MSLDIRSSLCKGLINVFRILHFNNVSEMFNLVIYVNSALKRNLYMIVYKMEFTIQEISWVGGATELAARCVVL